MKKPQSIRSILEKTLKNLEIDVPLKTYSILGAWNEIVGESVGVQTQPRSIRNRILFIDVSHSTWMQQLQFLKPTLLEKVNSFLGEPLIQDIRFKLGKISQTIPAPPKPLRWKMKNLTKRSWTESKIFYKRLMIWKSEKICMRFWSKGQNWSGTGRN